MRASILLIAAFASLPAAARASDAPFNSIELRGGGIVTVRHGPAHRVTVRTGGANRQIVREGDKLVVDRCRRPCPAGHRIVVEIVTPRVAGLAVTDGGLLQLVGHFPSQAEVAAAVSSGGTVDLRPLAAAKVTAAVSQGGRILASPRRELTAAVSNGGMVTYWGNPEVTSSVRHGGAVVRGAPADLGRAIAQLGPPLAPPAAPAPPVPPALRHGR